MEMRNVLPITLIRNVITVKGLIVRGEKKE